MKVILEFLYTPQVEFKKEKNSLMNKDKDVSKKLLSEYIKKFSFL